MSLPFAADDAAQTARDEFNLVHGLIGNPAEVAEVRDQVSAEDFNQTPFRHIYSAVLRLHDRRALIDAAGLYTELQRAGTLGDVGPDLLGELAGSGHCTAFRIGEYVRRVLDRSLERGVLRAAAETMADVESRTGPPEEILDRARGRFDRLAQGVTGTAAVPIAVALDEAMDLIDSRARGDRKVGVATGFSDLDAVLCGGLGVGQMTTVAARPSVGKTSFGLQIARNVARAGGSVHFVSLEQPRQELTERMLAAESGVPGHRIRQGQFRPGEAERIGAAIDLMRDWKIQLDDRPGQTAAMIAAGARRAKRDAKSLDLVVCDYLGLIEPENRKANRNEQTAASVRRLRDMARELGFALVLCCQLNRDAAGDQAAPRMHHLRDSGEIEQVSDVVIILHRKDQGADGTARVQVRVEKQRNGPLADVEFFQETATFTWREEGIET